MIYLDNSATTCLCEGARRGLEEGARLYANPSSLHKAGNEAKALIAAAERDIYASLGVRPTPVPSHKLIFTSCGTESNNLALLGVINAKKWRFVPRILTTDSEHPSVLEPLSHLEEQGRAEIVRLSTKGGRIDPAELEGALNERTVLVSIMQVNNETGALYDIKGLFALAKSKRPSVITHTDMTQGFLKTREGASLRTLNADLVTVSGHKIHAPKGIACLAVKQELIKSRSISPILFGGGQSAGLRSGTENVMGIASLAGACKEGSELMKQGAYGHFEACRGAFLQRLDPSVKVNQPEQYLPHIISITLPSVKSQTMLSHLSSKGIYVSSGSACSAHGGHKSYVLRAFGLSPEDADCTLRVSLSHYNTENELEKAAEEINLALRKLVRIN